MRNIILFFLNHSRINHSIFLLLIIVGVYASINVAKEIFPRFDLDMVTVSGGYKGASIDMMDVAVAANIESNIKNINGIKSLSTSVTSGRFTIIAELKKGADKDIVLSDIEDGVSLAKPTFPSDMDDPIVKASIFSRTLARVSISSDDVQLDDLVGAAQKLQQKILSIKGVYEAEIVSDSDFFYEVVVDEEKIALMGISHNSLFSAVSKLSYISPIGKIEDTKQVFLSASGTKTLAEFANTRISISGKIFKLLDVAKITKRHSDKSRLFTYNLKPAVSITIKQAENANAMDIVKGIQEILDKQQAKDNITYTLYDDNSTIIKERLNMVISAIIFGIILLFFALSWLINTRMAIIITLGIPVAFLFTIIYFYLFDFSINIISLIGLLIATGIIVDDAVVISENIQRYIEEGKSMNEAAINGVMELFIPVTIASVTTVFAFIPSLMISGTMGKFVELIPLAVSMTLIASLLEVFLFLPLHSKHILSPKSKSLSWEKANKIYLNIIKFLFLRKKMFLFVFIILTPIATFLLFKQTSFQLFSSFDSSNLNISILANENTKLEESFKIVREIEQDIMQNKEEWGISTISSTAGFRVTNARSIKRSPNSMYIKIDLYDLMPTDLVNLYVIPALSFFDTNREKIRTISSGDLARKVKKFIKKQGYKEKYNLDFIDIVQNRAGPVRSDIQIGLISNDTEKILNALNALNEKMQNDKSIRTSFTSVNVGIDEVKISLNSYGESLGLNESDVGRFLSNYYLAKKINLAFDKHEILDVKIQSAYKNDLESLKYQNIPLSDGRMVQLKDVATFKTLKSFDEIIKTKGERVFYVYANVSKETTASEVLKKYEQDLENIKKDGIRIILKGEKEKNKELARDMQIATVIAFILILIAMLYMFNSFKDTFIVLSVIPFSLVGVLVGHLLMDIKLSMLSAIGVLGLSGVVINDGIIMMEFIKRATNIEEVFHQAKLRLRPILLTSITTLIGLSTLIFFPYGQAAIFQSLTVSLGFGLFWGTILNLIYLPTLYVVVNKRFRES